MTPERLAEIRAVLSMPNPEDALALELLEALAVLERQVREYDAEASRAVLARQEAERRLAQAGEQTQVWKNAARNHHGNPPRLADCEVCALAERQAREALRAEPTTGGSDLPTEADPALVNVTEPGRTPRA